MTTLRDHDPGSTLPVAPGWRERIEAMDDSFRWAGVLGRQAIVAMMSGDEEKAARVSKVAANLAIEGFERSSGGWL